MIGMVLVAGCTSPIVGAECADGYAACGNSCVDLSSDPRHCGACGHECPSMQACVGGVCGRDGLDGGPWSTSDGSADDASGPFTGDGGAPGGDGSTVPLDGGRPTDGGPPSGCDLGQLFCGECVEPSTDPRHCGECGAACAAGEFCMEGGCTDECRAPWIICNGRCTDPRSDGDHCGDCGAECASGICAGSMCSEPVAGHVVVVGHDYRTARAGMNRVAGNAVFLSRANPVRVLTYDEHSRGDTVVGTDAAIDQVGGVLGRAWAREELEDASEVPLRLADADVFVIYAQPFASDSELADLAGMWERALGTFLRHGGVVVVFDGPGWSAGTYTILSHAGIFSARRRVDVSGRPVDVVAPGDAVALGVPLRYRGELSTVRFEGAVGTVVVSDGIGPVVVHQTFTP